MSPLEELHAEVEERVARIRQPHEDWPCRKGCDGCCRRLAAMPVLSAAEWTLLKAGLEALDETRQAAIRRRLAALAGTVGGPLVCPLLEPTSGICTVYRQRPVACRTYGYYVQRDKGLYCGEIESRVARGRLDDVVWGNHDRIERALDGLGEQRTLAQWLLGG